MYEMKRSFTILSTVLHIAAIINAGIGPIEHPIATTFFLGKKLLTLLLKLKRAPTKEL